MMALSVSTSHSPTMKSRGEDSDGRLQIMIGSSQDRTTRPRKTTSAATPRNTSVFAAALLSVMITLIREAVVPCDCRHHRYHALTKPGNAFKLPLLTGGIFGLNNNNNNNEDDKQRVPNATDKMGNSIQQSIPPPPPPLPPGATRGPGSLSSTKSFIRGSPVTQDAAPPPPGGRRPPPPPPPRKQGGSIGSKSTDQSIDPSNNNNPSQPEHVLSSEDKFPSDASFEREPSASWRSAFFKVDDNSVDASNDDDHKEKDFPPTSVGDQSPEMSKQGNNDQTFDVNDNFDPDNTNNPYDASQQQSGPPSSWMMNGAPMQQQQQQQQQGYYYGDQQQQQSLPPYPQDPYAGYLQDELNESLNRESALITQLDNLTTTLVMMEQKDELHTRQLDVLTERVMDVEAQAAEDRLARQEFELNCTMLQASLAETQEELDQWQNRCDQLQHRILQDEERLSELRTMVKEKSAEAERIAIAMEELRLIEKRREAAAGSSHKPISGVTGSAGGGGLFSWFWSILGFKSSAKSIDDDDEIREEAFEMAKSTLLRALQTERSNVHELEAIVANLQQNNSAISEMVESRDMIINELNNRIDVFEEDKLVLKAALKQLQKEIQEEAPRTQRLIDDLSKAEQEISRLKEEIQSIIETHQEELAALQLTISEKQQTISETESNLTAIGTYVDKLEERLTSFAVARRDIEDREQKCKEIEKRADETEAQRNTLEAQVREFEKQEDELKKLLEELATERADLQKDNRKLYTEREFRIAEQEQLEAKCRSLEENAKNSTAEIEMWKANCDALEESLRRMELSGAGATEKLSSLQRTHSLLQSQHEDLKRDYDTKLEEISILSRKNAEMSESLANATTALTDVRNVANQSKGETNDVSADLNQNKNITSVIPPPFPPGSKLPHKSSPINNATANVTMSAEERNVPMRMIRKRLSKATGLHGLITPSSKMRRARVAAPGISSNSAENKKLPPTPVGNQSRPVGTKREDPKQGPPDLSPLPPFSKRNDSRP